jgi:hypothetical protein
MLLGLALCSQAWAIIRPPFPLKPSPPPYRGHVIVISDDSIQQTPPKPGR